MTTKNKERKIIITIAEDGSIKIAGKNFKGKDCNDAMRAFEEAAKGPGTKSKRTEHEHIGHKPGEVGTEIGG